MGRQKNLGNNRQRGAQRWYRQLVWITYKIIQNKIQKGLKEKKIEGNLEYVRLMGGGKEAW